MISFKHQNKKTKVPLINYNKEKEKSNKVGESMNIDQLKEEIKIYTTHLARTFQEVEEPWETVTLYHGTTTKHLNEILSKGLTNRMTNQNNNFLKVPSNEQLVYLTTKWHYWYAFNANQESLKEKVGEEVYEQHFVENSLSALWNKTGDFPMYVVCEVPRELLTLDEDLVYQRSIRKKIREGIIQKPEDITIEECLNQGTIASLQNVSLEYINEIVILGSEEYREELLAGEYGEEVHRWFNGFGIGNIRVETLSLHEMVRYRKQIGVIENQYPNKANPKVQKILLENDELKITQTN